MSLSGKKMMVVDDEPDILAVLRIMLERWDARVDAFSSPFQAIDAFRKEPGAYDLVIADVRMPGMTGMELVKRMLAVRPAVRTMYISAFDLDHAVFGAVPAQQLEADLIKKPVTMSQLCEAVKRKTLGS